MYRVYVKSDIHIFVINAGFVMTIYTENLTKINVSYKKKDDII